MKNKIKLLLIFFIFGANVASAQKSFLWKTTTSGGYKYKFVTNDPMKARFYTLKNGLTVILSENHKEPRIQTLIPTRAGSNTDPATNTGLAHYLEHMLFKGTEKLGTVDWAKEKPLLDKIDALYEKYNKTTDPEQRKQIYKEIDVASGEASKFSIANEYNKLMASMGGQGSNAFTSYEQTVYTEDIPSNAVDRFLALQAERFRKPVLRIFHTELEAVYEEKNRGLDNDNWKVAETKNAALFPTHNYGQQTTIGTIEHLKNPSLVEIRNYFDRYYVPNNMAIIMAGDFNSDEMIRKIDKSFGSWKSKPVQLYNPAPEKPLTTPIIKEVFGPTPENVTVAWRWPGSLSTQEKVVGTILDELMSNSKAGLIDLNLTKAQLVLRAGSSPEWNKDYAVWQMTGSPKNNQSLDEVKNLLMGQLDKLKKGDFDESIIKAIAANNKLSSIQQIESNQGRAYGMLGDFVISKSTNWHKSVAFADALAKVTKQQVIDFANKYCGNGHVVVYKRKGEDKGILKVDKPEITPVETNRDKESAFLKSVNNMQMGAVQPVWLDFGKDLTKSKIGKSDVLYVQNKDNDLFRMSYRFDMGSWNSKIMPIAMQYINFLGTEKASADQISTEFYKLASSFGVSYTDHTMTLGFSGLNENFEKTMSLFENLVTQCQPNEDALELLKGRLMKQRNDNKLNKGQILSGLTIYAQYGAQNPRNALNLTDAELKNLKAADLIAFLKDLFNYSHQILYYGPKNMAELNASVQKTHLSPAQFKANLPRVAEFKKITPSNNQLLFAEYDMVQAEINWVRPTEVFKPELTPVIELYNNYFGGGMASIVFQTIRESKALAYSTYSYYGTPGKAEDKYALTSYVGTQADKLDNAIVAMNELLNVFPAEPKNLEIAKDNMKKSYQTERITQDGIIYSYIAAQDKGLAYDERQKVYETLDKLSINDLKAFQEQNISNKAVTYCLVASEKKIKLDDLKKYGEVKKLTLEEIFGY